MTKILRRKNSQFKNFVKRKSGHQNAWQLRNEKLWAVDDHCLEFAVVTDSRRGILIRKIPDMNDFKLTYLTSFNFSAIFDDCVVRPTVFNSHGWPEEPETSSRLIIFTEEYTRGAFLYNANDVILFSIENFKNVVRSR